MKWVRYFPLNKSTKRTGLVVRCRRGWFPRKPGPSRRAGNEVLTKIQRTLSSIHDGSSWCSTKSLCHKGQDDDPYRHTDIQTYIQYMYTSWILNTTDMSEYFPRFQFLFFPKGASIFPCLAFVFRFPRPSKSPQLHPSFFQAFDSFHFFSFFFFPTLTLFSILTYFSQCFVHFLSKRPPVQNLLIAAQDCEDASDEGQRRGEQSGWLHGEWFAHAAHVEHLSAGRTRRVDEIVGWHRDTKNMGNLWGIYPLFASWTRNIPSLLEIYSVYFVFWVLAYPSDSGDSIGSKAIFLVSLQGCFNPDIFLFCVLVTFFVD